MPFRRFFAQRGAQHPVAYSMATLAAGMVICMAVAVVISVQASERAIKQNIVQERQAQQQARQLAVELDLKQQAESRTTACLVITSMAEVYQEAPPVTPAGVKAAEAWALLARTFQCPER